MNNFYLLILSLLITGMSLGQETEMTASEIASFKEQVKKTSLSTQTIASDFIQYKHMDFLSNDIETFGKLFFKSPNLLKWEYTQPYSYSVIFKNDKLLINDDGTKSNIEMGSNKLFKQLNQLMINSVRGDMFTEEDFTISYAHAKNGYKVTYQPKDEQIAAYIASFELLFNRENGMVSEVKMIEPSQDFTRIVFSNRILNKAIDDAIFTH